MNNYLIIFVLSGLFILSMIYLFRKQLMYLIIKRGSSIIKRFIFNLTRTFGDFEPKWVLTKYPTNDTYTLGLITQWGPKFSTIFLPSGPRLVPGKLIFVANNRWHYLNIEFEDGLKMLVTLGLVSETKTTAEEIWNRMEEF